MTVVDRAIPFSMMFDTVFGIIILALILANAANVSALVGGFSAALSTGLAAVKK